MFRVHPATVARWKGLTVIRTPGGDRRYREDEVLAYLDFGAPAISHERPAGEPPAEALAGRNGTGAPGRFGGTVDGERPCHQSREGDPA